MPRRARIAPGEIIYHALNRANGRSQLFDKPEDYAAFERIMVAAMRRSPIRLMAYCLMPNHWHMVLWPKKDGEMTEFLRWLTLTHSQRLHAHRHTTGYGHIYQGRFKSFPVEQDQAALNVIRYVERNTLRANLVDKAQDWRWCSLRGKLNGDRRSLLIAWRRDRPKNWLAWVNEAQRTAEVETLRRCVNRGTPYGSQNWTTQIMAVLGLKYTLQPRGRPRKVGGLTDAQEGEKGDANLFLDEIAPFDYSVAHASASAYSSGWRGLSHPESGERPKRIVCQIGRLCRV